MEDRIYRIKLLRLPPTKGWPQEVSEAYYGYVPGVNINHYIYSRVSREDAYKFTRSEALYALKQLRFYAKCEPPITVTY